MFWIDDVICPQCRMKLNGRFMNVRMNDLKLETVYCYEGLLREMMIQYKELFDEALFPVFLWPYIRILKRKYADRVIVPVPSSQINNEKRGFGAVEKMFSLLDLPVCEALEKKENHDQKNLKGRERKSIGKYIRLKENMIMENRKILLVDDIVTTGETMKACHDLLKEGNDVFLFSVAVNRKWLDKKCRFLMDF